MKNKSGVNLRLLKKDIQTKNEKEIDELIFGFILHSYNFNNNPYDYKDCRKAANICIRELIKRGRDEEEILEWSGDK